jgi:hypothetical protein
MQKAQQSAITGGLGATIIDGDLWFLFNIKPELAFGKFGAGLDINLRFNKEGKIRKEDFKDAYGYLRMIRYLRWGQKDDDFYIRVGSLDYARLGNGFILNNYTNSASYDLRKIGLEFDLNAEFFGGEFVYSDFARGSIFGTRLHILPFRFIPPLDKTPLIKNVELGATYVVDFDSAANYSYPAPNDDTLKHAVTKGNLTVYGFDLSIPIISIPMIKSKIYVDYAKIIGFGNGAAAGISFNFAGMGMVRASAKYERRFLGDKFLPTYFNTIYERERFEPFGNGRFISKVQRLDTVKANQGNFGELLISILNTLNIVGNYYSPVGVKNQGEFHARLEPGQALPDIMISAGFDKTHIGRVFVLDEHSRAYAMVGYKATKWMFVAMVYEWTFKPIYELDANGKETDQVIGYATQKRIEPRVGFTYSF